MTLSTEIAVDVHLSSEDWQRALREELAVGLRADQKWLSPVWFYDEHGSQLFDEITRLPEYYPTRAERALLAERAHEIVSVTEARCLVELGSGTSDKTTLLLDALDEAGTLERYVPFDVSEATVREAASTLAERYPGVGIHAVVGDFHRHLGELPAHERRLVAFLGSTIGNFEPPQRAHFLSELRRSMDDGDHLLLGADLVKDPDVLVAAYDDAAGITAAFNRNALRVINDTLDAEFDPDAFDHVAVWNPEHSWIEMRLRARGNQRVPIPALGLTCSLADGEHLRTEVSTKFTVGRLEAELCAAGFEPVRRWNAPGDQFSLLLARVG